MARLLFTSRNFGSLDHPKNSDKAINLSRLIGNQLNFMNQSHGNQIVVITNKSEADISVYESDGLVTNQANVALAVQVADCMPLLLLSKNVVAAVHVGRKGLLNQVAVNAIVEMKKLGAEQISGVVGPHICGNCYEVDPQMFDEITKDYPATAGKTNHLNLFAGLADQLKAIKLKNLGICTKENVNYFSHRAYGEVGRQVGVISL